MMHIGATPMFTIGLKSSVTSSLKSLSWNPNLRES